MNCGALSELTGLGNDAEGKLKKEIRILPSFRYIKGVETGVLQHFQNKSINLRLACVKRNWGKQRTAYHAVNDFNSLSEMIRDSANVNIFKRQLYSFLI